MSNAKKQKKQKHKKYVHASGFRLTVPFFTVLAGLTVISFILPLRPAQSHMEKRNLAQFPEFSVDTLISGAYFDDVSAWFSDTFPGRESWLALSSDIASLHGYSEITIEGELPVSDTIPVPTEPPQTQPPVTEPEATIPETEPRESTGEPEPAETATAPAEAPQWGGVDAGEDAYIKMGSNAVIQIGDAAFNSVGFSEYYSSQYAACLNRLTEFAQERSIRLVSAPCPTAVGVMVAPEFLEKLKCANQGDMIDYIHSKVNENVVAVDLFEALVPHNDEYIYFRTDHHWTALGAYYSYAAICEALGHTPAALEDLREWNMGEFMGTLYWDVSNPGRLKLDELIAYTSDSDITTTIYNKNGYHFAGELVQDMSQSKSTVKYSAFIQGDFPLTEIVNSSIPDGPVCVLIKDSYGNCLSTLMAQTYHKIYVIDYRKFSQSTLTWFLKTHEDVQEVIFAPYLIAPQDPTGVRLFQNLCR